MVFSQTDSRSANKKYMKQKNELSCIFKKKQLWKLYSN